MPREDYEKAIRLWPIKMKNSRYKMELSDDKHVDGNLFFVIRDSETTYIKPYQKNMDITQGIVLDVLPLDGYPNKKTERKIQCFWALIYSLYCAQTVPVNHGRLIAGIGKIMLLVVPNKKIRYKIWKYAERQMTKYRIENCNGITELWFRSWIYEKLVSERAFGKSSFFTI